MMDGDSIVNYLRSDELSSSDKSISIRKHHNTNTVVLLRIWWTI